jgi:hypothetical protein
LTTTVSSDIITGKTGSIYIKLTNSGNEAAYDVRISLLTNILETETILVGRLNTNEPVEKEFKIIIDKTISPGKYPVVVLVDYADANSYPFSSVSPVFIIYKNQTTAKISGLIPEIGLSGKESKKLTLSLRNLDDKDHDVDVKLILPREIKAVDSEKKISVGSKQEKSLDFEVSSLSAISGSTYAVLASIEYEENSLYYSSFANGVIKIDGGSEPKTQETEKTSTLAYVVLFISICFVLIYAYQKYIKRGKKVEKEH